MSRTTTRRTVVLGAALGALALLAAAPTPAEALHVAGSPSPADPTAPLVALLSLVAWAVTGWLLVTVALTAGGQVPGRLGSAAGVLVRRVAPASVRRAVAVALGLSVALGAVGAAPAAAAPGPPAVPHAAAPALDWPAAPSSPDRPAPALDWAAPPAAALPEPVVVTRGDSLWRLAAADLAARSGTAPSDAQVAHAWPQWWAANRDAVGDDPHLLRPGTPLTPPTS